MFGGMRRKLTQLLLMDKKIQVTANLAAALRRIQQRYWEVNQIWVDAVCINQGDNEEKNTQVALMREIYKNATGIYA